MNVSHVITYDWHTLSCQIDQLLLRMSTKCTSAAMDLHTYCAGPLPLAIWNKLPEHQ